MNPRKKIEKAKKELTKLILSDIENYKRAVIRRIFREYSSGYAKLDDKDIKKFADKLQKTQFVPSSFQVALFTSVQNTQTQIASLWDNYFQTVAKKDVSLSENDFEKMLALYQIEFSDIDAEIANQVIREVERSVKGNYGFNAIRKRLEKTGLGIYSAENLARTALAQFDNSYHTEIAQQAGAKYFLYDGVISPNTRAFCRKHVGGVYTLAELKAMNNRQGLPVETSLGGYRCTHMLTALIDYKRKNYGEKYK